MRRIRIGTNLCNFVAIVYKKRERGENEAQVFRANGRIDKVIDGHWKQLG